MSNKYLGSDLVKVYPSGYRDASIDLEASRTTEGSITKSIMAPFKKRAFVKWDGTTAVIVIDGYVFTIEDAINNISNLFSEENDVTQIWATIKTTNIDANDEGTISLKTLVNYNSDTTSTTLDEDGNFYGLVFSDSPNYSSGTTSVLVIEKSDGEWVPEVTSTTVLNTNQIGNSSGGDPNTPINTSFYTEELSTKRFECEELDSYVYITPNYIDCSGNINCNNTITGINFVAKGGINADKVTITDLLDTEDLNVSNLTTCTKLYVSTGYQEGEYFTIGDVNGYCEFLTSPYGRDILWSNNGEEEKLLINVGDTGNLKLHFLDTIESTNLTINVNGLTINGDEVSLSEGSLTLTGGLEASSADIGGGLYVGGDIKCDADIYEGGNESSNKLSNKYVTLGTSQTITGTKTFQTNSKRTIIDGNGIEVDYGNETSCYITPNSITTTGNIEATRIDSVISAPTINATTLNVTGNINNATSEDSVISAQTLWCYDSIKCSPEGEDADNYVTISSAGDINTKTLTSGSINTQTLTVNSSQSNNYISINNENNPNGITIHNQDKGYQTSITSDGFIYSPLSGGVPGTTYTTIAPSAITTNSITTTTLNATNINEGNTALSDKYVSKNSLPSVTLVRDTLGEFTHNVSTTSGNKCAYELLPYDSYDILEFVFINEDGHGAVSQISVASFKNLYHIDYDVDDDVENGTPFADSVNFTQSKVFRVASDSGHYCKLCSLNDSWIMVDNWFLSYTTDSTRNFYVYGLKYKLENIN